MKMIVVPYTRNLHRNNAHTLYCIVVTPRFSLLRTTIRSADAQNQLQKTNYI